MVQYEIQIIYITCSSKNSYSTRNSSEQKNRIIGEKMKKILVLTTVMIVVLSMVTAYSIAKKDTQTKYELDLSKVSFKMKIQDAYMINNFGVYLTGKEKDGEVGVVLHGKIENGKVNVDSKVIFVDENGKVLHRNVVFKIEVFSNSFTTIKRQSFAESGDDVALYFKDEKLLEFINEGQFVVLE